MPVRARALYKRGNWDHGVWEFLQLPAKGDRITLKENGRAANPDGSEDVFEVLYIEHVPISGSHPGFLI
jgi:hypothetical protein